MDIISNDTTGGVEKDEGIGKDVESEGRKNKNYLQQYDNDYPSDGNDQDNNDVDDLGTDVSNDGNDHAEQTLPHVDDLVSNYSLWITADGTDFGNMCYLLKNNTSNLGKSVEQLSDLQLLALHDIYFFNTLEQPSSTSKDWPIDLHRQAMASLSTTYGEPSKALNSAQWCMDLSLAQYNDNDWMPLVTTAVTVQYNTKIRLLTFSPLHSSPYPYIHLFTLCRIISKQYTTKSI
ncbi:hypothetical protein BC941DRAFT_431936 [Chlamydoabsidia padenii]|nr:hypothetical protein BC941DRAFT_431936 [Chlamydoabsidia padenii]